MMYGLDSPETSAASMYSSSRTGSVAERTTRIRPGAASTPRVTMAASMFCGNTASTTMMITIAGTEKARSASQLTTRSIQPPQIAGGEPERHAEHQHDDERLGRPPTSVDLVPTSSRLEHVAAEGVGAEQVLPARPLVRAARLPASCELMPGSAIGAMTATPTSRPR